jgi:transposase-like protein
MADKTDGLKQRALHAYAEFGVISHACQAVGIARSTWYDWVETDPAFAQAAKDAEEAAIDSLEQEARRRARDGSDVLLMFCLKAKRPEYRDRQQVDLNMSGAMDVNFSARVLGADERELAQLREEAEADVKALTE